MNSKIITQAELQAVLDLQEEIERRRLRLKNRLAAGAAIESGALGAYLGPAFGNPDVGDRDFDIEEAGEELEASKARAAEAEQRYLAKQRRKGVTQCPNFLQ